jgi:hypothetical protein
MDVEPDGTGDEEIFADSDCGAVGDTEILSLVLVGGTGWPSVDWDAALLIDSEEIAVVDV